jgi:hypothetical protein
VATRATHGRRARFTLRNIIRGWPFYYETAPVFPNEVLLRTVPNTIGYYTPDSMGKWIVSSLAFEPRSDDVDGISLFREDFVTKEQLARLSGHPHGVRVARVTVKECGSLHLSVNPSPDADEPPGHVVIPEMPFLQKAPQNKAQKQKIKALAQELALIAGQKKVYTPPGLPNPVTNPKKKR